MTPLNFGPLRRAAVSLAGALLVGGALTACQSPLQQLDELAQQHGRRLDTVSGQTFPLLIGEPINPIFSSRIRVYLEGDGRAWATRTQPSLDPSPHDLLVARIAFSDPLESIYLARPCQFVSSEACTTALWTDRRYSAEVLASLDQALDAIRQRYHNKDFELIGYSGGGALALLLAATRDDVAQVQTLAGNLSPRYWAQLQQLTPLSGSLEPLDFRERLARLPQRHLLGHADRVIPDEVLQHYQQALGAASCMTALRLQGVSHAEGWETAWHEWRERPIDCLAVPENGR